MDHPRSTHGKMRRRAAKRERHRMDREANRAVVARSRRLRSEHLAALILAQDGLCALCGAPLEPRVELHHNMPLARGGTDDRNNLRAVHPSCNAEQGYRLPRDYSRQLGLPLSDDSDTLTRGKGR